MHRFAALLLATATLGQAAAGELSGLHVPPYPEGLVNTAGSCIRLDGRPQSSCSYGFGVLEDPAGIPRVLYAGRLEGHENSGKPKWLVLDSFTIPRLPSGARMALSECTENGTVDQTIVAVVRNDKSKEWLDALLVAKRFDLTKGTFSNLAVKHVRCKNVGMG